MSHEREDEGQRQGGHSGQVSQVIVATLLIVFSDVIVATLLSHLGQGARPTVATPTVPTRLPSV
jgi:hypothetical protein